MGIKRRCLTTTVVMALVLAGVIAGCAPAAPAPTQAPAAQPTQAPAAQPTEAPVAQPTQAPAAQPTQPSAARPKVELKALVRNYSLDQDSPWRLAAAALKQRHPEMDIEVTLEGVSYDDLRRKSLLTLQAGQGYDIIQMDNIWLGEFVDGGLIKDLTP